ncbi:MAG: hypothetical protein A2X49_02785 [Lentisphaerae bacterium GWF2_52_8]|nr:MAG: hypothetical protein A2X49_02785 [Lentisphaerae bacterium GWF2_52_8]
MKNTGFFKSTRFLSSIAATVLLNLKAFGLTTRSICAPGFHCHGCPWANAACPIGVLAFSSALRNVSLFALTWVVLIGIAVGRMACAFACPFGLLQDLIYKIPSRKVRLPEWTRWIKYGTLALLVFILPWLLGFEKAGYLKLNPKVDKGEEGNIIVTVNAENIGSKEVVSPEVKCALVSKKGGMLLNKKEFRADKISLAPGEQKALGELSLPNMLADADISLSSPQSVVPSVPRYGLYFCRICPAGALTASLPAKLSSGTGASSASFWSSGGLLDIKFIVLGVFLVLMLISSRAFCRILCPLGALYGLLNKLALIKVVRTEEACVACGICNKVCPVELDVLRKVGGPECISCGDCVKACPKSCFKWNIIPKPTIIK